MKCKKQSQSNQGFNVNCLAYCLKVQLSPKHTKTQTRVATRLRLQLILLADLLTSDEGKIVLLDLAIAAEIAIT